MEQLVEPNYVHNIKAGLCLVYSRSVFGAPAVYATAWDAWNNAKYKHTNKDFPEASVPVWFDWWGKLPGDKEKQQYGHTAVRDKSGKVYSSPLSGTGHAWFNSVDDLVKAFGNGMKYVGWSEDINNVRVVQEKKEMPEIIDQDTSRILISSILGYTGVAGRPDALDGSDLGDSLKGRPLTASLIKELFQGATAVQWRDSNTKTSISWINTQLLQADKGEYKVAGELFGETFYRKK